MTEWKKFESKKLVFLPQNKEILYLIHLSIIRNGEYYIIFFNSLVCTYFNQIYVNIFVPKLSQNSFKNSSNVYRLDLCVIYYLSFYNWFLIMII